MSYEVRFLSVEEAIHLHAYAIGIDPALAATLLWGLVLNHPFHDGNKRTGWFLTQAFLHRNGFELPSTTDSVRLVLGIARGRRDVGQVEQWIRTRLEPLS